MKFIILAVIVLYAAAVFLVGPVLLIPVLLYLLAGMTIYLIGTHSAGGKKSITRRCKQKRVFKDESIDVTIEASAVEVLPSVENGDPWNIVLVIDNSSSMMGTALGNAKIAAKNLVYSTPPDFRYGLVEFRQIAHIRSQLTSNRMKLKQIIDRIVASGSTAIHEGLHQAAGVLQQEITNDKKNALILLSDGKSAHGPALKEANELKMQGVEIYTIGLGDCDTELMKQIASDNEKYFYAKDPKKLKQLYHTIGRIIQNARGNEVEVTEYPNVKKAPFHIFGWGDMQPSTFDFESANPGKSLAVEWYLPALQAEGIELDYRLRSRCYGWYRISDESAQLKLKDQNNNPHTFKSNRGPYILIIPRFFMWQIFWIFLNPLFWMIFGKWICKGEEIIELEEYEKPEPVPVPQPEVLPTLQTRFKLSALPTLAVGVGYGGLNAVTHLKRMLWEHNEDEEIREKVVFTALDTVNPWFGDTVKSGHIELEPGEKLNIDAPVSEFLRSEADREEPAPEYTWLNARQKRAEGIDFDTGFGTNLERGIGRLKYLHRRRKRYGEEPAQESETNLKTLIRELHEKNKGETIQICLAGTMSGGTAGGTLPELCYTIRKILDELNIVGAGITLFLMDYQVENDDARRDDKKPVVQANKDGLINELARFFTARANPASPLPDEPGIERWFDRIVWVDKKQNTTNRFDLYPQCAVLMYSAIVEKDFNDYIRDNTRYIHDGLLVHRFETDTAFFFKRTLENYYSVRLLLTTLGDHVLGLSQNPADYSVNSIDHDRMEKYIDDAFELLYRNPRWKNSLPLMLKNKKMILDPQPQNISIFLSNAGMTAVVDSSAQDRVNKFVEAEESAFDTLLSRWIECQLATHKDERIVTPREKKLPTAYLSLLRLKENIAKIRNTVERIPETAEYLLKKRCQTVAELCATYTKIIDEWKEKLEQWWTILGDGNEYLTGTGRALNLQLNELEKSIQATRACTTPHFAYDAKVEDEIYRKYFAQLEHRILEQMHWQVDIEARKIRFIIVDQEKVNTYPPDRRDSSVSENIYRVLLALPAYFAAEKNRWHEATIREILEFSKQAGQDVMEDYFVPRASVNSQPNLLYLEPAIAETLEKRISAGLERKPINTQNPLITGFFKYKLNHEAVSVRTQFDPRKLPAHVFSEEWNSYNALTIYSNLVDEEPLTPPYAVVALCRNMKKFLGAVKKGILENEIREVQAESRMVYRFHTIEAPLLENEDDTLISLLRIITESKDPGIETILADGYKEFLQLNLKAIKSRISKTSIPLSDYLKELFFQLSSGAVEYYKNLN